MIPDTLSPMSNKQRRGEKAIGPLQWFSARRGTRIQEWGVSSVWGYKGFMLFLGPLGTLILDFSKPEKED